MTQRVGKLFAEAMELPEHERSDLIVRLLEALDPGGDDGVEVAWDAELEKRIAELTNGDVQAVPWPEARRMILDDTDDADCA